MTQTTILWLGLALLALACTVATAMLYRRMRHHEQQQQVLIDALRSEIHSLTSGSIGMGRRLLDTERRLDSLTAQHQQPGNRDVGLREMVDKEVDSGWQ